MPDPNETPDMSSVVQPDTTPPLERWMSAADLAERAGVPTEAAASILRGLVLAGALGVVGRRGTANLYGVKTREERTALNKLLEVLGWGI